MLPVSGCHSSTGVLVVRMAASIARNVVKNPYTIKLLKLTTVQCYASASRLASGECFYGLLMRGKSLRE